MASAFFSCSVSSTIGDHFFGEHGLEHTGRVGLHVGTRRDAATCRQQALTLLAQDEVCPEPRRVGMWCLGGGTDLHIEHADRIDRPVVGRHTGKLHVHRQIDVVGQRHEVFAGAHCARHREMPVDDRRLERRSQSAQHIASLAVAVMLEQRRHPFAVVFVNDHASCPVGAFS